eukprot:jgi/Tetstr1/458672/TSEL_045062.t1
MEAALNLCEWKLTHNIKTAAFERLSKLLEKHMLLKDGSELTETWYQWEQCLNVPDIKNHIVHCCPLDEHRYGPFLDGDWSYDDRCPLCNLTRWTPESPRHPHPATPQPRKLYYDFNVYRDYFTVKYRGKLYMLLGLPMGRWSLSPYYFCSLTASFNRHLRRPDFALTSQAVRRAKLSMNNGRFIYKSVETAYMHVDSSGYGWGAVLNETTEARGFWYDGDLELHITYKEL